MRIFLKYGIPPLIPLFLSLCVAITAANYLPVFNGRTLFDLFPILPENHISKFTDKGTLAITGKIASIPEEFDNQTENSDKRIRFDLSVDDIFEIDNNAIEKVSQIPGRKVTGTIQMNVYNPVTQHRQGDTIQFKGKIKSLRNFNNPGGFDYVRYMQSKDLWGRVNANGRDITLCNPNISESDLHSVGFYKFSIDNFRDNFTTHIFNNIEDKDSGAILCALVTGNTKFISEELIRDFSETGVSHILSVSGLHLSIVATLFFYLFNLLLSCSEWVLIRGWSKKGASLLTLFPIVAYSILSGNSDATQRSMIMITIFMTASVVERQSDMFNSLAASGIVILLVDPLSLFAISFQLSFSAVFFILMGLSLSEQYHQDIPEIKSGIVKKLASFIFISLCATAGTQILVMHYFNLFSFSGVFANLVIIPGVGFGALYLGFAALFIYPFSIQLSGIIIKCSAIILKPSIALIKHIAALPWSYVETFIPDVVEIACYYLFMSALFVVAKFWRKGRAGGGGGICNDSCRREKGDTPGMSGENIFLKGGLIVATISSLVIVIHEGLWINRRFFNSNLCVTVLDVGQGNSALIEMPKGKNILVDGGGFSYTGKFDTGENIVAPFLRQKRIMTLDAVVLTHPDADHLNGLVYIVDHFRVRRFIKNCDKQDNRTYKNLMAGVEKSGSQLFIIDGKAEEGGVKNGSPESIKIGDGELYFFHPLACTDGYTENIDINSNSTAFKVIFDKTSIFFPGDIIAKTEHEISYKYGNGLKSDILIAPHHGSAGSSSDFFLDQVAPESIVISCGWQNRFGFPRSIVISRYQKRRINIFRTDLNGAVNLSSDGTKWEIKTFL